MASFSVITNVAASNAQANLYATNVGLKNALTRVSSGFRINYSGDDAAGLAVANSYRSDIAIISQGVRNANDGLSDLQIKDGALDNISKLLDRLATLATQAASGQTSTASRTTLNAEFKDVVAEITREATVAGVATASQGFSVFVSNDGNNGAVSNTIGAADTTALGLTGANFDITTAANASALLSTVANAVGTLGTTQASVGTLENRLTYAISLAQSQVVSNKAAESRIRDANVAEESANMTRYSILTQSGISALAQANQQTASVLKLLG